MSVDKDAKELYNSSKVLKYYGAVAFVVMLVISGVFFWIDTPALGFTFAVCSLMFVGLSLVGNVTMKSLDRRRIPKQAKGN